MYFKILKKDLKRKKSMNLILLIFILLATTFIAGSLNNIVVIMNGTDYFLEKAGVSDYLIFTMNRDSDNGSELSENDFNIIHFLDHEDSVKSYEYDNYLFLKEKKIKKADGTMISLNDNTTILNSINVKQQKFFDEDDREIKEIDSGMIYMALNIMDSNKLKSGDEIYIEYAEGVKKRFKIAGYAKDAGLGSEFMGTKRCIISEQDYREIYEGTDYSKGGVFSVWCNDLDQFEEEYNKQDFNTLFSGDINKIELTYIMNMVIAGVILLVSVFLVIISVVMLRFTIVFTINEDYKEIGIMKAIGMKNNNIRKLYMAKYFVISVIGACIGGVLSIPFSDMLISQVSESMVLKNAGSSILFSIVVSIAVVVIVGLFAYISTGKIKGFTPMDAIRNGNNGERFKRKGIIRLRKCGLRPTTFMAVNDILSELKKYLILLAASVIGIWLVVMLANTINTLDSDEIISWFGAARCDYWIVSDNIVDVVAAGNKQVICDYMEDTEQKLKNAGVDVKRIHSEALLENIKITKGEKTYQSMSLQGIGTKADEYFYDKGEPPAYENEVAITHMVADKIDAHIGDTVYIKAGDEAKPFIVTAIYQSLNNLGEGIRFHEDAEIDYHMRGGAFGLQVTLNGKPDKKEIKEAIRTTERTLEDVNVYTEKQFVKHMIGSIADRLGDLKVMALALVIIVNILIVVLMQKMFFIREKGQMGMLKSIGFKNSSIIGWQTKRIMLVLFLGIILGLLTGTPFSQITSGQIFKLMGASRIEFQIKPLEVYVLYPVAIFVSTVIACIVTMRKVKKISVWEMNDID